MGMSDIEREAFESYVFGYDTLSDGWQDKGVDDHFIAGFRAGQAAREQEVGEVVAEVVEKDQADEIGTSVVVELGGHVLLPGDRLCTHSRQSQGVPEGWRSRFIKLMGEVQSELEDCNEDPIPEGLWLLWRELLSTPAAPQAGEWVKCADRLPAEADDDYQGCVWAHFEDGDVELMEAEEVEQTWDDDISITHWKPTDLTRPQPPQEG